MMRYVFMLNVQLRKSCTLPDRITNASFSPGFHGLRFALFTSGVATIVAVVV